jgi:hypothetical protein
VRNLAIYALSIAATFGAAPAWAGSTVATPAIDPPTGGYLRCLVSNASETQTVEVEWGLYGFEGEATWGPATIELTPLENIQSASFVEKQSACVARVLKGGKGSVRLTLVVHDANGNVRTAVEGR